MQSEYRMGPLQTCPCLIDPISITFRKLSIQHTEEVTVTPFVFRIALLSVAAAVAVASAAFADLNVRFVEGAPKDRFLLENTGSCVLQSAFVTLDLGSSRAGLIFDVSNAGAGVEVFQPFEIVEGDFTVLNRPTILDGDTKLTLELSDLKPGDAVAFTIDVDDTVGQRAITVSDDEISGATVAVQSAGNQSVGVFAGDARVSVPLDC